MRDRHSIRERGAAKVESHSFTVFDRLARKKTFFHANAGPRSLTPNPTRAWTRGHSHMMSALEGRSGYKNADIRNKIS